MAAKDWDPKWEFPQTG